MIITPQGFAVMDDDKDRLLSRYCEHAGKLAHDDGIAVHYLPCIKPGSVCVDAGAAIGDHTAAYIQKTGDASLVHAFECNPDMVECLRHNCPGCHIYQVALSDIPSTVFFHSNSDNAGGSYCDNDSSGGLPVPAMPMDSFNLPPVGFIKWDLEGYEIKAIRGAMDTIMRGRPVMMVEVIEPQLRRAGGSASELIALLMELRYQWHPVIGEINSKDEYFELCCEPL